MTPTTPDVTPHRLETAELVGNRRGPLRTVRDVVAIIRDVLLIVLLAATLFVGGSLVNAIDDAGSGNPDPVPTECIGEVC